MPRIPNLENPIRGRGTKMRGPGSKSFSVPTVKTVKPPKAVAPFKTPKVKGLKKKF